MKLDAESLLRDVIVSCGALRRQYVLPADDQMLAIATLANLLHTEAVRLLSELTGGDEALAVRTLCQAHLDAG